MIGSEGTQTGMLVSPGTGFGVTVTSMARYPLQHTFLHSLRDPQICGFDLVGSTTFLWFPTGRQQLIRTEAMVKLAWV